MPKSGSREPEGQLAERPSPKRKAEEPTRRAATPKWCVPKSGSREPEGQPAERQLRSGACRKAEAVSPKTNPPSGNPEAVHAESGSREPEGQLAERPSPKQKAEKPTRRGQLRSGRQKNQLAERQPRSGACRKAEAVSPKVNSTRATPKRCVPKSGSREPEGQPAERQSPKRKATLSGENHRSPER